MGAALKHQLGSMMKYLLNIAMAITASLALLMGGMNAAEAAKGFGGGKSFGSKFSQSQALKKSSPANSGFQRQATPAQTKNTDRKQALANRGGLMGMLGGLAIGGLLGALFFGGAFENINFFDILIFGAIAFLLFKLMAGRARQQPAAAGGYGPYNGDDMDDEPYQQRSTNAQYSGDSVEQDGPTVDSLRSEAPKKFDQADFLAGAKNCFARLQKAWDEGDLADIRQFTTDHVFAEIQDQLHGRGEHGHTEIAALEAELLSATDLGSRQEAIVLFKAELKEDGKSQQIEEVWHFVKANTSHAPSWQLDGIQQVEG